MIVATQIRKIIGFAAIVGVVMATLLSASAYAKSDEAANVLKISPVRSDIVIDPGKSKSVQVTITNPTKYSVQITPEENDFVSNDETGTPSLIQGKDNYAPAHSLKRFMTPLGTVTLKPGESKTIQVKITVPKDAQAGGYFGAVRFTPTSPDGGGQVNLSVNVAPLILLRVPGAVVEKLNLTDFKIEQSGIEHAYFRTPDNLSLGLRFKNTGNVQEGPFGHIAVKKGDKVVYQTDFNTETPRDMILPDSARRWDVPLKNIDKFGKFTIVGTFSYGQTNQTIEVTKTFWVVPIKLVIAALVGLVILIAVIVGGWLFLRGYKNRVLRGQRRRR